MDHEQWRLVTAGAAFVVGGIVGLIALAGSVHPLYGGPEVITIGEVTSLAAAAITAVVFVIWFVRAMRLPANQWRRQLHIVRRIIDLVGLTLTHASVAMFTLAGAFWIFSQAFRELTLDAFSGAAIVGAACAGAAYLTAGSAYSLTTRQLSELLAGFVLTGALAAMLTASNPVWWQEHFSSLGTASDTSGIAFNFTLLLGGLAITTLAGYLTHDLLRWARLAKVDERRVVAIRIGFIAMGVLLALLAFLPVDRFFISHNVTAYSLVGVFIVMIVAIPFLFPTLSKAFSVVCAVTVGLLALGLVMFLGVHYLNLTAFELLAVAGIFAWLILFIGTVQSAADHLERNAAALGDTEAVAASETPMAVDR